LLLETKPLNPSTPNQIGEQPEATSLESLPPIVRIGVESELSKFPVHNLAQRGSINIEIRETNEKGQLQVKWEVSYNSRYGRPGPLAYKTDTTVVNRRIDDARRVDSDGNRVPLPEVLPIGALHEIADMLNLGGDTNSVKRALRQNVGILISAKIKQKTADGTERMLEADFTRYSVIFTGEKLPDGTKADRVYLVLHKPYRDILDSVSVQPQNWMLKDLPAASHRFYVLLSNRMYATLGSNNQEAKILYSYFCQRAPLTRHEDYKNFKSQMYKIQKPLKQVGYIKSARWEERKNSDGSRDWMMCYIPGPLAKAEYNEFNPTRKQLQVEGGEITYPPKRPRQRRLNLAPVPESKPAVVIDYRVTAELAKRGVGESKAREMIAALPPDFSVLDVLEWGDLQVEQARGTRQEIKNPAGFYIHLLEERIIPPSTFESSRARKSRQEAESAKRQAFVDQQRITLEAEEADRQRLDAPIDALPAEDRQILFAQAKAALLKERPQMADFFRLHPDSAIEDAAVRKRMREFLTSGWQPSHPIPKSESPHYAINPSIRQATPLQETAPVPDTGILARGQNATTPPKFGDVLNLKNILTTPQLPAPVEQAAVELAPATESQPESMPKTDPIW
jgi:hypothetical protein